MSTCRDCGQHTTNGVYARGLCRNCYQSRWARQQWTGPNRRRIYRARTACLDCGRTRADAPRRTLIRGRCARCYARAWRHGLFADLRPTWPCAMCGQIKPYLHTANLCDHCYRAKRHTGSVRPGHN